MLLPERSAWKMKYAPKLEATPAARLTAVTTTILAASTTRRRGTAHKVARIVPVLYSPEMTSTPSTPIATWEMCSPPMVRRTLSMVAFWWGVSRPVTKMASSAATPTLATTAVSSAQDVERTVRSLQYSDRSTLATAVSGL